MKLLFASVSINRFMLSRIVCSRSRFACTHTHTHDMNEITNQVKQHTVCNAKLKDHIEYRKFTDSQNYNNEKKKKQGMNRLFALMRSWNNCGNYLYNRKVKRKQWVQTKKTDECRVHCFILWESIVFSSSLYVLKFK